MWNPATAVLWESWRLSRQPMAIALFLATLGGAALIVLPFPGEMGVTLTVPWVIYLAWFSQHWALKIDGRKGFSLLAGFSRPIPTWVLVTVPMAYVAASSAVTYLVPILVLRTAFGLPLPHLPVAALVSALSLSLGAFSWSSANPVRRRFIVAALWLIGMSWLLGALMAVGDTPADGLTDPYSFSTAAYGWMGLFSAAAFWVAIAGVARQRRGDDAFSTVHPTGVDAVERRRPGPLSGIADRFRTPCPTSSPMSAQLWLEVHTVFGPVLKSGTLSALAAPIFFTILNTQGAWGEGLYFWVWFPLMVPVMVALPSMLGVRRRQGVSYLDAFAATRPLSTGHLVGLKVLVTSLSIFLSWAVLVAVLWVFAVWLAVWGPETQAASIEYWGDWFPPLSGAEMALHSTVYVVSFTAAIAAGGALHAFLVLNGRRVVLTGVGVGLYIASWVIAGTRGWVDMGTIETIVLAHLWIVTLGVSFGTAYFFRRWMAERLCTWPGLSAILVIGVGFLFLSLYLNPNPDDIEDHLSAFILGSLPLIVTALLPWSFSRLRHR